MKHLILMLSMATLMMVSCKKDLTEGSDHFIFLKNVKSTLKDSLGSADFQNLDFSRTVRTYIVDGNITLVRIPFKEKSILNEFVLVQTETNGMIEKGRIVNINGAVSKNHQYNGSVTVTSLYRQELINSAITKGKVDAFVGTKISLKSEYVVPDPYVELPEVIIVSTYSSGGGGEVSWSTWMSLQSFFSEPSGGGGGSGWYSSGDPYGGGGGYGGGSGGGGGGTITTEEPIEIDFENQYDDPAIQIEKYMKCFTNIPDAGATGSIEIFTDLPVNGDPTKFFDWENGSPGHTFIQLRKQNGTQSVSQNIGFYPVSGWKTTLTPAPINGKFVDNQGHEYNASIKINLNAAQIQTAVTRILYLARFVRYDIDDYNCTDWALSVFNEAVKVEEQISDIPRYDIPGGMAPNGTSMPQGLYIKLQQMKQAGGSQAANISIPLVGWVGQSGGPCN